MCASRGTRRTEVTLQRSQPAVRMDKHNPRTIRAVGREGTRAACPRSHRRSAIVPPHGGADFGPFIALVPAGYRASVPSRAVNASRHHRLCRTLHCTPCTYICSMRSCWPACEFLICGPLPAAEVAFTHDARVYIRAQSAIWPRRALQ